MEKTERIVSLGSFFYFLPSSKLQFYFFWKSNKSILSFSNITICESWIMLANVSHQWTAIVITFQQRHRTWHYRYWIEKRFYNRQNDFSCKSQETDIIMSVPFRKLYIFATLGNIYRVSEFMSREKNIKMTQEERQEQRLRTVLMTTQ